MREWFHSTLLINCGRRSLYWGQYSFGRLYGPFELWITTTVTNAGTTLLDSVLQKTECSLCAVCVWMFLCVCACVCVDFLNVCCFILTALLIKEIQNSGPAQYSRKAVWGLDWWQYFSLCWNISSGLLFIWQAGRRREHREEKKLTKGCQQWRTYN